MRLTSTLHIQRLRVRGAGGGATGAVRPAIERLLAGADLQPPGAPPSAVLIVRRLIDPQPRGLAAAMGAARVHAEWERAVRDRLGALYRAAARPALGPVPASAEAVVFADEAELLACLALDVARGLAGGRWWWRAAPAGRVAAARGLAAVLVEHAALVPALLAELRRRGVAAEVVAALSLDEAAAVLSATLRAFDLPHPAAGGIGGAAEDTGARTAAPPTPPPWGWAGPPELGRERLALLGIAADARDRPAVVRRAAYWAAARRWWAAARPTTDDRPPTAAKPETGHRPATAAEATNDDRLATAAEATADDRPPATDHRPTTAAEATADDRPPTTDGRPLTAAPTADGRPTTAAQPTADGRPLTVARTTNDQPPPTNERRTTNDQVTADHRPLTTAPTTTDQPPTTDHRPLTTDHRPLTTAPPLPAAVPTRLGGVLYLINLMAALDLPDGFDEGWRLDDVGAWGLLEGLARGLLGDLPPDLAADPLWAALAQLDGRAPGQPPGARLPRGRPRRWPPFRLPPAWRAGLPPAPGPAAWRAGRGRLWLLDPAGYPLADLPRAAAPAAQAAAELSRYRLAGQAAGAAVSLAPAADLPPLLARWLALALPFIRHRLGLALRAPAEEPEALGDWLHLPATLHLSRTHVDLLVPLERVALAARRAGLDRDPGWMPLFGRIITFHFE